MKWLSYKKKNKNKVWTQEGKKDGSGIDYLVSLNFKDSLMID